MSHEAYEVLISAQLDGALTEEEEVRLAEHLAVCPQCRQAKAELEAVRLLLAEAAAVPPPGLREKILAGLEPQRKKPVPWGRRIAPFAAAAVIALVVLGVAKPQLPFNETGKNDAQAEYAMAEEASGPEKTEEAAEAVEAAVEEGSPAESAPEDPVPESAPAAGQSEAKPETSAARPVQHAVKPPAQTPARPAAPSAGAAKTETPDAAANGAEDAAAAPPSEAPAVQDAQEPAEISVQEEPNPEEIKTEETVTESAEPEEPKGNSHAADSAGGGSDPAKEPAPQSSTLTWQQARDRLIGYLGGAPEDLSALGMSSDGAQWLFTAGGSRYAVDMHSGAVTPLS